MRAVADPRLVSLGHDEALGSTAVLFQAAAERIAALHPEARADELFARMTSPAAHHATLRGKLLLMECACPGLARPHAFYLLGAARSVAWHSDALGSARSS